MLSGHPYPLTAVTNSTSPNYPFSQLPAPPEGYSWDDISYVVGGYNWKARFLDQDGFIITGGDTVTATQYNLENDPLNLGDEWVASHPSEEVPYDCGHCHTTGYSPVGNQDGRAGIVGTWAFSGVQCEACHGPGSLHANDPVIFNMEIDRDAEACDTCHVPGDTAAVIGENGFIPHHDTYADFFQGKHAVIDASFAMIPILAWNSCARSTNGQWKGYVAVATWILPAIGIKRFTAPLPTVWTATCRA